MSREDRPAVVAELGRPETPQETADRKAATSRRHREGQTLFNLVVALVATLVTVLIIVLMVVRPDAAPREPVDYQSVAAETGSATPLAAPTLPDGWNANAATFELSPADGVTTWYVGFITPDEQFLALRQGVEANPTWLANQVVPAKPAGTREIAGVTWTLYDQRGSQDAGNLAFAMTAEGTTSSFVVFGTASDEEFDVLATALAETILED